MNKPPQNPEIILKEISCPNQEAWHRAVWGSGGEEVSPCYTFL